jgi:hypothetical protein
MSGERREGREAVENMTQRLVNGTKGLPERERISEDKAREIARRQAKRHEQGS